MVRISPQSTTRCIRVSKAAHQALRRRAADNDTTISLTVDTILGVNQ